MGSSSKGTGPDSTLQGKIDPPLVARPYVPSQYVNHALPGNWMGNSQPMMDPHGTTNPAPYTDPADTIMAGINQQGQKLLTFQELLRQLGISGSPLGQMGMAPPNQAPMQNWAPMPMALPPAPPPAPLGVPYSNLDNASGGY